METKEYTTIDRSGWPSGEWDGEPDKVQWQDEETGLPCLAVRNRSGAWCGYVGVAEGHPWFKQSYDDVLVECHGGPTFSDFCQPHTSEADSICHVPGVGEPDRIWWIGFDCNHGYDWTPRSAMMERDRGYPFTRAVCEVYRTLQYVKNECRSIACQAKEVEQSCPLDSEGDDNSLANKA